MRQDIETHINTGDFVFADKSASNFYPFIWKETSELQSEAGGGSIPLGCSCGEIDYPYTCDPKSDIFIRKNAVYTQYNGLCVKMPYRPKYEPVMIRIRIPKENGLYGYVRNPVTGLEWFPLKACMYGKRGGEENEDDILGNVSFTNIYASELITIAEGTYRILFNQGIAQLYSSEISDFNIIGCDRQNANFLLKCNPTNNYRYPLTGVGITRWINGDMADGVFAKRVSEEFIADGVFVKNCKYDSDTQELNMDLNVIAEES